MCLEISISLKVRGRRRLAITAPDRASSQPPIGRLQAARQGTLYSRPDVG
jgi:hypothetical protein